MLVDANIYICRGGPDHCAYVPATQLWKLHALQSRKAATAIRIVESRRRRESGQGDFQRYDERKRKEANDRALFFPLAGVSIFVNGFTRPTAAELKELMGRYGGRYENYLHRGAVTHIICSNLPQSKLEQWSKWREAAPVVVKPEWIVDSIKVRRKKRVGEKKAL